MQTSKHINSKSTTMKKRKGPFHFFSGSCSMEFFTLVWALSMFKVLTAAAVASTYATFLPKSMHLVPFHQSRTICLWLIYEEKSKFALSLYFLQTPWSDPPALTIRTTHLFPLADPKYCPAVRRKAQLSLVTVLWKLNAKFHTIGFYLSCFNNVIRVMVCFFLTWSLHMILFALFHSINPWIRTLRKFQTSRAIQRDKLNSCLAETTKYQDQ